MIKDSKAIKILILIIIVLIAFIPGIRSYLKRGENVKIEKVEEKEISTTFTGKNKISVYTSSGDLYILEDPGIEGIFVETGKASILEAEDGSMSVRNTDADITLRIGRNAPEEIHVTTTSGDIEADGINFETLNIYTSSGDITITDSNASNLTMTNLSGNTLISFGKADGIYHTGTSGTLELRSLEADNIVITSISGKGSIEDVCSEKISITTTSGEYEIYGIEDFYLDHRTTEADLILPDAVLSGAGFYGDPESTTTIKFASATGKLIIN